MKYFYVLAAIIAFAASSTASTKSSKVEKVIVFSGTYLGGSYTPAASVYALLEERLKGQCEVKIDFSEDELDYYKGLMNKEVLLLIAQTQQRSKKVADFISYFYPFDLYNAYMLYNKTIGKIYPAAQLQMLQELYLVAYQARTTFDPNIIVISTVPFIHNSIAALPEVQKLRIIIACIPCDADDMFDGAWVYKPEVLYFLYSEAQIERAKRFGCKYVKISGLPLRPEFKGIRQMPKREMKQRLGFSQDESLTLIFFGAAGSDRAKKIAEILENENAVIICGKNKELEEELKSIGNHRHRILGFVSAKEIAEYARASDCVVGKTGGAQTFESIECESVFLFMKDKYSLPWEDGNGRFLVENGVGRQLESLDELPVAIAEVIENKKTYEERFAGLKNNGAEEVGDAIAGMVEKSYEEWQDELWGPLAEAA